MRRVCMKTETSAKTWRLDEVKSKIIRTAAVQAVVLVLACLMLDGGACLAIAAFGVAAHWIGAAVIVIRRRNALTQWDVALLQVGFVLFPAAVLVCALAVGGILKLVGVL